MSDYLLVILLAGVALLLGGFMLRMLLDERRLRQQRRRRELEEQNAFRVRLDEQSEKLDSTLTRQAAWRGIRLMRVVSIDDEAEGIRTIELAPHDGMPLPGYLPGQYLMLNLKLDNGLPLRRCYSLSGAYRAGMESYRISVKRVSYMDANGVRHIGRASGYLHDSLHRYDGAEGWSNAGGVTACKNKGEQCENKLLEVFAPGGDFTLQRNTHRPRVFLAGGIGITPLLAMWESLVNEPDEQETWLFYSVRNGAEALKAEYLRVSAKLRDNLHLRLVFTRPDNSDRLGEDFHHAGHLDMALLKQALGSLKQYDYYLCGPTPMMEALHTGLRSAGVSDGQLRSEAFVPDAVKLDTTQLSTKVHFLRSDKTVHWHQVHGTLLELAEAEGVPIDSSCRMGQCGTCRTRIVSGSVRHLGNKAPTLGANECLPCIAIPEGNLLELDA